VTSSARMYGVLGLWYRSVESDATVGTEVHFGAGSPAKTHPRPRKLLLHPRRCAARRILPRAMDRPGRYRENQHPDRVTSHVTAKPGRRRNLRQGDSSLSALVACCCRFAAGSSRRRQAAVYPSWRFAVRPSPSLERVRPMPPPSMRSVSVDRRACAVAASHPCARRSARPSCPCAAFPAASCTAHVLHAGLQVRSFLSPEVTAPRVTQAAARITQRAFRHITPSSAQRGCYRRGSGNGAQRVGPWLSRAFFFGVRCACLDLAGAGRCQTGLRDFCELPRAQTAHHERMSL
jgi:hypothetical protein